MDSRGLTASISKRGLRYDLTVPFARYVVMNQNDLQFPFKRYQIQPVWRADRPQKGRYQEFYQCDVDAIGSTSLSYEAELTLIYDEVFAELNIPVRIRLNNRKVLYGISEAAGIVDRFVSMTVVIDKVDKIGWDGVQKELKALGIEDATVQNIIDTIKANDEESMRAFLSNSEIGLLGLSELNRVKRFLADSNPANEISFDYSLARGLSYYTGCIFEVEAVDVEMGSLGGGGRYDDLTGIFGLKDMSGVGISFGAERIYDVMEQLDLFPDADTLGLKVLVLPFTDEALQYGFNCVQKMRETGIISDLYPEPVKFKKQMKYANARKVPYVLILGAEELDSGILTLKNMITGTQDKLTLEEVMTKLSV